MECGINTHLIYLQTYPNTFTVMQTYTHISYIDIHTCTCVHMYKTSLHTLTGAICMCKHPHTPDREKDVHIRIVTRAHLHTSALRCTGTLGPCRETGISSGLGPCRETGQHTYTALHTETGVKCTHFWQHGPHTQTLAHTSTLICTCEHACLNTS